MKKYHNLFEYLAAEWFQMVAGILGGLSIPIGFHVFPFPDCIVFLPLAVLFFGTSWYYKFYRKA